MLGPRQKVPSGNRLYSSTVESSKQQIPYTRQKRSTLNQSQTLPCRYLDSKLTESLKIPKRQYNPLQTTTFNQLPVYTTGITSQLCKSQVYTKEPLSARRAFPPKADQEINFNVQKDTLIPERISKDNNILRETTDYAKLIQKLNRKQKIIKELQKLCEEKVSDNLRSNYAHQKQRDQICSPLLDKKHSLNRTLGSTNQGVRNTIDGPASFTMKLNGISSSYSKYQKYIEDTKFSSPARKGSDFTPNNKNVQDCSPTKQSLRNSTGQYMRQNKRNSQKLDKEQKIFLNKLNSNEERRETADTCKNDSGLYSYKNAKTTLNISSYAVDSPLYDKLSKEKKQVKQDYYLRQLRERFESKSGQTNNDFSTQKTICLRDFELKKTLGQGKFGIVYQALHKKTNSLYALKKISKKVIKTNFMQDQFLQEVKIQRFCNHQNILKIYGYFDDFEHIYLILEYMEEGTLFSQLKTNKTLSQQDSALIIKQIVKAVVYLHQNGIAHRDIKPENIVMSHGVGKLCDFGWAAICTDRRKTYCGTFDYVAPEILQGSEYDVTVDLWCIGVLAYEILVGKAPFYHISRKETMKKIMNVEKINYPSSMSGDARSFIEGLLKKNPDQRMYGTDILNHPFLANVDQFSH